MELRRFLWCRVDTNGRVVGITQTETVRSPKYSEKVGERLWWGVCVWGGVIRLDGYSLLGSVKVQKYRGKGQKGTEVEIFAVTLTKCTG